MPTNQIYLRTLLFSLMIGAIAGALHYFNLLGMYPSFTWTCFVFFTLLSFLVIGLAGMSGSTSSGQKALQTVLLAMMLKFVFSLMMIVSYVLVVRPVDASFILPFFFMYTYYTVIETYYLLKMPVPVTKPQNETATTANNTTTTNSSAS